MPEHPAPRKSLAPQTLLLLTLAGGVVSTPAFQIPKTLTLPLDAPTSTVNTLDVGVSAVGTVPADLGGFIGVVDINIDTSDTETSTVSGALLCDLDLEFNPATLAVQAQAIQRWSLVRPTWISCW